MHKSKKDGKWKNGIKDIDRTSFTFVVGHIYVWNPEFCTLQPSSRNCGYGVHVLKSTSL